MSDLLLATKTAAEKLSEVLESARKENPETLVKFNEDDDDLVLSLVFAIAALRAIDGKVLRAGGDWQLVAKLHCNSINTMMF